MDHLICHVQLQFRLGDDEFALGSESLRYFFGVGGTRYDMTRLGVDAWLVPCIPNNLLEPPIS